MVLILMVFWFFLFRGRPPPSQLRGRLYISTYIFYSEQTRDGKRNIQAQEGEARRKGKEKKGRENFCFCQLPSKSCSKPILIASRNESTSYFYMQSFILGKLITGHARISLGRAALSQSVVRGEQVAVSSPKERKK